MQTNSQRGTFFLVVGPSGVGKDTLMEGARLRLGESFLFARRVITRPADAGGEAHEAASAEDFAGRAAAGGFIVSWQAHGLNYGLPIELLQELESGRHVIANGSRGILSELAGRVPQLVVLSVLADRGRLEARIVERGRESGAAVAARLDRKVAGAVPGSVRIFEVMNDASIAEGVERFLQAIRAALAS